MTKEQAQNQNQELIKNICITWIFNSPNNIGFVRQNNDILSEEDMTELEELAEFLRK
jgi:adenine-specific DNA methylase